jgi:hypothetical protein
MYAPKSVREIISSLGFKPIAGIISHFVGTVAGFGLSDVFRESPPQLNFGR